MKLMYALASFRSDEITDTTLESQIVNNSFQIHVDTYIASCKSNFTDYLRSKGFLLEHMYCEGTPKQNNAFKNAMNNPTKVTAIHTIKGQKIYIVAIKLTFVTEELRKKVQETLSFAADPRHPHCREKE